jgi:uncharacterized protein (TIGR02594 family)
VGYPPLRAPPWLFVTEARRGGVLVTALDIAETYLGIEEGEGTADNPIVLGWLREAAPWPGGDQVPWCGAFARHVARRLRLPHPKEALGARRWLQVGTPVALADAQPGMDVVILKRGGGSQPGPEVIDAPGHVGFYAGRGPGYVTVLGGNQSDAVTVSRFPSDRVLGIRRLA